MEKKNFGYSLKNIPIPNKDSFVKSLICKTHDFIKRLRWKAIFYVQTSEDPAPKKETYGFNSEKSPPQIPELLPFENDLYELIKSIVYKDRQRNRFQSQLQHDVKEIQASPELYVPADKTTNIYKVSKEAYTKLLTENITSSYKKTTADIKRDIDLEAKKIACNLKIGDRAECFAERNAFITIKDHKENFPNTIKCRLLNPAKSDIGRISKRMLEKINDSVRSSLEVCQWRNTDSVVKWFEQIEDKAGCRFVQFDVVEFYPSISSELLTNSINFAAQQVEISSDTINTIMHSRKSLLFDGNGTWIKKNGSLFDVTMGSYDGAEVCELVGIYLLCQMKNLFADIQLGLYRDDGLGLTKPLPGPEMDRMKKAIIRFFQENGLKITITANLVQVNFLDVTLDLSSSKYWPYRKDDDQPLYINKDSNHSPSITKQLPKMIESRISALSCSEEEFNKVKDLYNTGLSNSGFNYKIAFTASNAPGIPRTRKRNIVWFNPPFNSAVKTNIGRKFLLLLDKHFPTHHKFARLFNRNSVKISYSACPNMSSIISKHNKQILNSNRDAIRSEPDQQTQASQPSPPHVTNQPAEQVQDSEDVHPPGQMPTATDQQQEVQAQHDAVHHTPEQASAPVMQQSIDQVSNAVVPQMPDQASNQVPERESAVQMNQPTAFSATNLPVVAMRRSPRIASQEATAQSPSQVPQLPDHAPDGVVYQPSVSTPHGPTRAVTTREVDQSDDQALAVVTQLPPQQQTPSSQTQHLPDTDPAVTGPSHVPPDQSPNPSPGAAALQSTQQRSNSTPSGNSSTCNCRQRASCPLNGKCLESSIIYTATITTEHDKMIYIGSTALTFKSRYSAHKSSFNNRHLSPSTSLSNYIWELKDKGTSYNIKWEIVKHCSSYTCGMRKCDLCLTEKLMILRADSDRALNRNSEIMQKCRHSNKFKLMNVK